MINQVSIENNIVYLYPSSLLVKDTPTRIHTILGSCVAVCLFDKNRQIGGINHYMLPYWNGSGLETPKYGNIAIEKLIGGMLALGSKKEHLIAKVFGGASVLEVSSSAFNIGDKNIGVALDMLKKNNIPVIAQSTGGTRGRKIIFNTQTGEVIHRLIKSD